MKRNTLLVPGRVAPVWLAAAVFSLLIAGTLVARPKEKEMGYNELTPEEESVILRKGTEAPYSGEYTDHYEPGTYHCKRCDAPLYRSDDKFDSHCGWPGFDDEIPGAVKRLPDADGRRTEILCAGCGGHLGHVFSGERQTEKNVRHCVNSISLVFRPVRSEGAEGAAGSGPGGAERAYFAGGCFWGTEHFLRNAPGVLSVRVGYMGGAKEKPTYQEVCAGWTGHAEAIEVVYDPAATAFEDLARLFFEIHDPTQVDRQGPDVGDQYRSAIFYADEKQKKTSENLIRILEEKGLDVATELVEAEKFWEAEDYHQDYYEKTGHKPYCHARVKRF